MACILNKIILVFSSGAVVAQYLQLGPGSSDLLQCLAAQTLHQLTESLTLNLSQTLLLLHLQTVHLFLIVQLLLTSLRQPLQLCLLRVHTKQTVCLVTCQLTLTPKTLKEKIKMNPDL